MLQSATLLLEQKPLLVSVEEGSRVQRLLRLVAKKQEGQKKREKQRRVSCTVTTALLGLSIKQLI